jgi:hypothetical protein
LSLEPLDAGIPGKKAKDLNHGILGIHGKKTELKLGKGDKPLSGLPDAFAFPIRDFGDVVDQRIVKVYHPPLTYYGDDTAAQDDPV